MSTEERLKEKVSSLINDLKVVIGYAKSNIPLRVNPLFIDKKEEIDKLIFNNLCINNLATYSYFLSQEIDGKIGIRLIGWRKINQRKNIEMTLKKSLPQVPSLPTYDDLRKETYILLYKQLNN